MMLAAAPLASANVTDRQSAARLVAAETRLASAWMAREQSVVSAERAYVDGLSSGCGSALSATPPPYTNRLRGTSDMLSAAGQGGFQAAALAVVGDPVRTFAASVARLHWSSPAIAARFARSLAVMRSFAAASVPDICAAARRSAAAHYGMVPAGTQTYARLYDSYMDAQSQMPYGYAMGALDGSDRAAVARLRTLQHQLSTDRGETTQSNRLTQLLPLSL
jgi:hypothetical protein